MNKEEVRSLRQEGLTLQEIGDRLGVSRQRIFQLLNAESSDNYYKKLKQDPIRLERYRKRKREASKRFYLRHPEYHSSYSRDYARKFMLEVAGKRIWVEKRPRPDNICELCGGEHRMLHYHHWDDKHPEKGLWVCRLCHWICEAVEAGRDIAGIKKEYLAFKQIT